jgi:hypothetical protein
MKASLYLMLLTVALFSALSAQESSSKNLFTVTHIMLDLQKARKADMFAPDTVSMEQNTTQDENRTHQSRS